MYSTDNHYHSNERGYQQFLVSQIHAPKQRKIKIAPSRESSEKNLLSLVPQELLPKGLELIKKVMGIGSRKKFESI
jgi:hypothetical protein